MKTRIISGVLGISLLIVILFLYETIVLNIASALVCSIIVYEIFCATKMLKKEPLLFVVSVLYSISFPFLKMKCFGDYRVFVTIAFVVFNIFYLFKKSNQIRLYNIFFCCFFIIFSAFFMSGIVYLRDIFSPYGIYYIILFFLIPWVCDAGAYFVGRKLGKTKLAPKISPKKTVEGAIGGVLITFLIVYIYNFAFLNVVFFAVRINYFSLFFSTFFGVIFSIVGDLCMSVFKRQNNIKDFGDLIRGQGGVLDRFDSFIFASAVLYPFVRAFPIVLF